MTKFLQPAYLYELKLEVFSMDLKSFWYTELLTPCYGDGENPGTPNYPEHGAYENFDPTNEFTYTFMAEFFNEIVNTVTKDNYVHLGMDEVSICCMQQLTMSQKLYVDSFIYALFFLNSQGLSALLGIVARNRSFHAGK